MNNLICKNLSVLIGLKIKYITRATNLVVFGFGEISEDMAQYHLHIQCSWRIIHFDEILLAEKDLYLPNSSSEWSDEFEWDAVGSNLFDEKKDLIFDEEEIYVKEVSTNKYGDVTLILTSGYAIELFIDSSANEEAWRFFEKGIVNKEHLVVIGTTPTFM